MTKAQLISQIEAAQANIPATIPEGFSEKKAKQLTAKFDRVRIILSEAHTVALKSRVIESSQEVIPL